MRTRPMLHEAEAKTYEAEATKFGLEAVLTALEDLTSLVRADCERLIQPAHRFTPAPPALYCIFSSPASLRSYAPDFRVLRSISASATLSSHSVTAWKLEVGTVEYWPETKMFETSVPARMIS